MQTFLFIVFFLSCIVLVVSVLLQPGKTDAGALFTSGVSNASMNPRGTASVLSKLTIAAAAVFMLTALLLSLPAITGDVSVLQTQGDETSSDDVNANTANTNSANSNSNSAAANANTGSNSASNSGEGKTNKKEESDAEGDKPKTDENPS